MSIVMKTQRPFVSFLLPVSLVLLTLLLLSGTPPRPAQAHPPTQAVLTGTILAGERATPEEPISIAYTGCGGVNAPATNTDFEEEVIRLTNIERANNGLPPLKHVTELENSARYHATDMGQDNYFSHDTYDGNGGTTYVCDTWARISTYYTWNGAAENIAHGYTTPAAVMNGWMNSSGHRANILDTGLWEIGVGYYNNYWVQNFGRRNGVYPIVINGEAPTTDSVNVTLYIYGTGTWTQMRLRNDGGTWGEWQSFQSTLSWTLNNIAGDRTVEVELSNGSQTTTSSDTIELTNGGGTTYSISGQVLDGNGYAVAGVTISDGTHSTTTDTNGNYTLSGLPAGDYTLTPSLTGYSFSPSSQWVSVSNSDVTGINFTATAGQTYSISGQVLDGNGYAVAGVTISDGTHSTTTDTNGNYTLSGLPAGDYTLTPSLTGYSFSPSSQWVSVSNSDVTGINFTATPEQTYSISGQILDSDGNPVAGVTVSGGAGHTAVTDANGYYTLYNLSDSNFPLTLSLSQEGFAFDPAQITFYSPPSGTPITYVNVTPAYYVYIPLIWRQ